jgi:hypothetical protein
MTIFLQAPGVRLDVGELKRIGGNEIGVECFVFAVVVKLGETGARVDTEMLIAMRTDVQVCVEILLPDDLAATFTFNPETFRFNFLLAGSVECARFSLKPTPI